MRNAKPKGILSMARSAREALSSRVGNKEHGLAVNITANEFVCDKLKYGRRKVNRKIALQYNKIHADEGGAVKNTAWR
jgi:hypothetical protein